MNIQFQLEKQAMARQAAADNKFRELGTRWIVAGARHKYTYQFTWMGRPIIQFPQDMVAMQEIIWQVRPDLIIETGIAHGGSLIYYASLLELIGGEGLVLGIDVDIRPHNRIEIESHSMSKRIQLIQGSAVDEHTVQQVRAVASGKRRVLVALDSNHTHEHVLRELELYSPLVTKGSYLIVFDTIVEDMPKECFPDRPWGPGNNPKTAVQEFLKRNRRFVVDEEIDHRIQISVAPSGYLKCIAD